MQVETSQSVSKRQTTRNVVQPGGEALGSGPDSRDNVTGRSGRDCAGCRDLTRRQAGRAGRSFDTAKRGTQTRLGRQPKVRDE